MDGIPVALESDADDVAWALQTAETLWKRKERAEAIVWLRRAAQAAGDAEDDDRALALARIAADLAERGAEDPAPAGPRRDMAFVDPTPEPMATPRVPSAAEVHAGMLDPWADADGLRDKDASNAAAQPRSAAARRFEPDEVVTSAPPLGRRGARPLEASPRPGVDLSGVEAFGDLPDDAREAFGAAAGVEELARNEEVSSFALALVLSGAVDLAATIVDAPAKTLEARAVVSARGTIDHAVPLRLICASDRARIAVWDEGSVTAAFRTCPWVEDELRAEGDRVQALVGATMGPLGERLDAAIRAEVTSKLDVRVLAAHEVFAERGRPIPGLLLVGTGELELVAEDGVPSGHVLRAGDFLFPSEVLRAAPAPMTARASRGGAIVLFAQRRVAQELLVTCPPLLEVFAGA